MFSFYVRAENAYHIRTLESISVQHDIDAVCVIGSQFNHGNYIH
jgi:hypothetical protein